MKRKLLFAIVALMCSVGTWAYTTTDLTSAGWTLATSLNDIENNYYVLVDAAASETAVVRGATANARPRYRTIANPLDVTNEVWTITASGTGYTLQNYDDNFYFNSGNAGWNDEMNSSTGTTFTFTYAENKWSIKASTGFVGPWNNSGAVTLAENVDEIGEGVEDVACNKSAEQAPGFILYSISRTAYASALTARASSRYAGFTQVTNASELTSDNFATNYYILVPKAATSYVVSLDVDNTNGNSDLNFQPANVFDDLRQVWMFEANNTFVGLRNMTSDHLLIQTESYGAYAIRLNNQANVCEWTNMTIASDGANGFTIENSKHSGNYLGLWAPTNTNYDGQNIAGNRNSTDISSNNVGHFYIYSIPRATFNATYAASHTDLTDLLLNPAVANGVGWAGGNTASGQQYTGAPDNTYLDRNDAEMNTNQQITLPAGDYIVKAATRASATQSNGHLYVFKSNGDIDSYAINKKGNTGNVLGNGWDWTMMSFTLTEQTTVGIGFYMGKSSWAGVDDWHLYKVDGTTPADIVSAFNAKLSAEPQNAAEKSAAQTAISTLQSTWSVNNFKDARTKVATTENSVKAYVTLKAEIDELAEIMSATNVYTAAAKTAAEAFATDYAAGTLADNLAGNIMGNRNWRQNNLAVSSLLLSAWNATSTVGATNTWGDYYINTWSTEGDTDGTNLTEPFYEYYTADDNTLGDKVLLATLTTAEGIEASATYQVSALVRLKVPSSSSSTPTGITFQVADGTAVDACSDLSTTSSSGYLYRTVTAYGASDAEGNLTIKFNVSGTNCSWLAFKNVKYTKVETDLSALKTAIDAGDAVTFGFADGEYAPYNNTAMLAALANAKTIYNNAVGKTQTEIDAAKDALNSAISNMTENSGEVSAISLIACYNADNKDSNNRLYAAGWDKAGRDDAYNTRLMKSSNAGLAAVDNELALFTKENTSYGKEAGYALPLKANTLYKLSFKYCGWGNTPNTTVRFTDPLSNVITLAPDFHPATNDGDSNSEHWYDYTGYFMTTAAGNYVLNLNKVESGQQQTAIGNIDLRTASELEFADGAVPTYAPGTYPSVKITRELTAGRWATAVYPFAVSGVDNIAVLDSYNKETGGLGFTSATASVANVPFLMRSTAGATEITLSNVEVAAAAASDAIASEASLKGAYETTEIDNSAKNYVLSNNIIYPVGAAGATISPYRAYIQIAQQGEVKALSFFVDDTETAIEGIDEENKVDGPVFNLAGQRVNKAQRGIYIVNGKKVLVK